MSPSTKAIANPSKSGIPDITVSSPQKPFPKLARNRVFIAKLILPWG
ncbi:MAG: hypothetical protein ACRC8Y_14025 [Chroococcales cyanobacterium]